MQNIETSVVIVGGGPVGLTLSALLSRYGIEHCVVEADAGYCTGSRAICVSRRSQEILAWAGAQAGVTNKGLPWTGGRSYWRDKEVLNFQMPHDATQRFAPMVNIQQFYIEQFAHEAAKRQLGADPVMWGTRLQSLREDADGVTAKVALADGALREVRAQYLVACDGGRSTVRELMGLQFEGMQYEGRYVIVDIEQKTKRPVERLAWFDPPSNPGSTILMHRQPDDVWRIDYQIGDDDDPEAAVLPENVLPRVQSHLDMIGETAPWKPLWISIYNAKCLTLPRYRHGRVLLAGDAAHMVPIFGVRGLNSGLDDVGNLAWKLAHVLQGRARDTLLDTFSQERVHATRENLAYGAKSTEFMAPPNHGFSIMREAALRLATESPHIAPLINPRQSTPIEYVGSRLNLTDVDEGVAAAGVGMPAPEALLPDGLVPEKKHVTELFGKCYTLLHFSLATAKPSWSLQPDLQMLRIVAKGQAWDRYAATDDCAFLIRPDGYIAARWSAFSETALNAALEQTKSL